MHAKTLLLPHDLFVCAQFDSKFHSKTFASLQFASLYLRLSCWLTSA